VEVEPAPARLRSLLSSARLPEMDIA
jgi:hypothetical protein